MKELTKKVMQAGLVTESTARLMNMWGMVDMPEKVGETEGELIDLVEQIGELLEQNGEIPEMRETAPELDRLFDTSRVKVRVEVQPEGFSVDTEVVFDRAGRIVFRKSLAGGERADPIDLAARPGQIVQEGGRKWEIFHVEPRFRGEDPVYLVCEVRPHA